MQVKLLQCPKTTAQGLELQHAIRQKIICILEEICKSGAGEWINQLILPLLETQQHETRRPREHTKVTYLKKQIEEQNNKVVSNKDVINTLQPFFTLSTRKEQRKARRKKNTESITGKIMKCERVYLYWQTLLLKTHLCQ